MEGVFKLIAPHYNYCKRECPGLVEGIVIDISWTLDGNPANQTKANVL